MYLKVIEKSNSVNIYFLAIPIVIGILFGILVSYDQNDPDSNVLSKKNLLDGASILGDPNAKITIVEFGDYQCTFCYKFHQDILPILKNEYINSGKIKMVFKDFPLNGDESIIAGEATYCAEDQNRYWAYHNVLYENWAGEKTGWIKFTSLYQFARYADLDLHEFTDCLSTHEHLDRVLENERYANKIGINATPTFLVFDDKKVIRIIGAQPIDVFRQVISEF